MPLKMEGLIIANGTTTGYVLEALRGTPVKRFEYCVGLITGGMRTENPNSDHTLLMWIEGKWMARQMPSQ